MNGWGDFSPITQIYAASRPASPLPISLTASDSSSLTVQLDIATDNRGLQITQYRLFKDAGSLDSEFSEYAQLDATELSFTGVVQVTGLTAGLTYRFYSVAENLIGTSDPSVEALFAAAALVSKPAPIRRHADSSR